MSDSARRIVDRIVRKLGAPDIVDALAGLGATDLQSLLLEVYRRRSETADVGGLLGRYRESRFARPSERSPALFLALDRLAYELLPAGFDPIELSPVAPFGATAIVTGTSQNRIVSTIRNSEVAADSTNMLALECAVRRQALLEAEARSREIVQLATSQRLMRAQALKDPAHTAHFRLFALCSAGRDSGSFSFELGELAVHIGFYLALLEAWSTTGQVGAVRVPVTPIEGGPDESAVTANVIEPLAERYPHVEFAIDLTREQGRGYYEKVCFHVYAEAPDGASHQLADGGCTNWTKQLVGSNKERLMISGIGSEMLVGAYR